MLFASLLLPLAVSAVSLGARDTAGVQVSIDKLEPRYRKTANRYRYKIGRKYGRTRLGSWLTARSIHPGRLQQGLNITEPVSD